MKPYNKINLKVTIKAALTILGIAFVLCIVARPISGIVLWLYSIGDYFAYAFCNPSLWLLGFDEVMWECPVEHFNNPATGEGTGEGVGQGFLIILSVIVHIIAVVAAVSIFSELWNRVDKGK